MDKIRHTQKMHDEGGNNEYHKCKIELVLEFLERKGFKKAANCLKKNIVLEDL